MHVKVSRLWKSSKGEEDLPFLSHTPIYACFGGGGENSPAQFQYVWLLLYILSLTVSTREDKYRAGPVTLCCVHQAQLLYCSLQGKTLPPPIPVFTHVLVRKIRQSENPLIYSNQWSWEPGQY